MTWVLAGRHLFCARCLADVQVTLKFKDRAPVYFDGIQKVHIIGPNFVVAFADSIRLGFYIIEKLKNDFYPKLDSRLFTNSRLVLEHIYKYLLFIVKEYNLKSSKQIPGYVPDRVELMILFQPKIIVDLKNLDPEEFPSTEVWKMEIPSFNAWEPEVAFQLLELGSGAVAHDYREIVARHEKPLYEIPGEPGEKPTAVIPIGKMALQWLFVEALEYQNAGISKAMHVVLLSPELVAIKELPAAPDVDFPKVVDNWKDFKKLVVSRGFRLADFSATA